MTALSDADNLRLHDVADGDVRDDSRWIALMGEDEVKAFLASMAEKHLPGRHDQSSHGRGRRVSAPDVVPSAVALLDKPPKPRRAPRPKPPRDAPKPPTSRPPEGAAMPSRSGRTDSRLPSGYRLPADLDGEVVAEYERLFANALEVGRNRIPSEAEERLRSLERQIPDVARAHIEQNLSMEQGAREARDAISPNERLGDFKQRLTDQTKDAFAGKKIAARVTKLGLNKILASGRFKTQFETNYSKGRLSPSQRRRLEAFAMGLPEDLDPTQRPIYGYVAIDGVQPIADSRIDKLTGYGDVQVIFKDDVRKRTTAMFGDSLMDYKLGRPEPVDNPSWQASSPALRRRYPIGPLGRSNDYESPTFRAKTYAEAQIHGGLPVSDIEEVVFAAAPDKKTVAALAESGVPWRVLAKEG